MSKKRISVGPGGKIKIKRNTRPADRAEPDRESGAEQSPVGQTGSESTRTETTASPNSDAEDLRIPRQLLIDQATLLTESQVRPHEETDRNIEIMYLMSGDEVTAVDEIHGMASSQVVIEADSSSISWCGKVIDYLKQERSTQPSLVLMNHTHPSGSVVPSATDMADGWTAFARNLRETWSGTRVLFGIHGLETEFTQPKPERAPTVTQNTIEWQSTKRPHRFRVYSERGNQIPLTVI